MVTPLNRPFRPLNAGGDIAAQCPYHLIPTHYTVNNAAHNRILHIPRRFVAEEWGGTETVLLEISREQQRAGWQPEILTSLALSTRPHETIGGVPVRRFK
jgi:hypothetical protein